MHLLPLKIGISSCLLGHNVRYDGGHKRDDWIVQTLGEFAEFVAFCPEAGSGLGIPRPAMHLKHLPNGIRAVEIKHPDHDHTDALTHYIENIKPQITALSGYILKKNSPSCGMERVKIYAYASHCPPQKTGVGIFVQTLKQHFPLLPLEEEGRLCDPILRENFIARVYAYHEWQQLLETGLSAARLVQFHTRYKYTLMAHHQPNLKALGQAIATVGQTSDLNAFADQYIQRFMETLKMPVDHGQHANVLMHLMGYLKQHLDTDDKAELYNSIQHYQLGVLPLLVPITLLKHHFRRHPHPHIEQQAYLEPHPYRLMLRNPL